MSTVWPVSLSCGVLDVSVSGYFEHRQAKVAKRASKAATPPMRRERLWKRLRDLLDLNLLVTGIDPAHPGLPVWRP